MALSVKMFSRECDKGVELDSAKCAKGKTSGPEAENVTAEIPLK
jgi:hypothetical protein